MNWLEFVFLLWVAGMLVLLGAGLVLWPEIGKKKGEDVEE